MPVVAGAIQGWIHGRQKALLKARLMVAEKAELEERAMRLRSEIAVCDWRIRWIELEHDTARVIGREPRKIDEVFNL